MQVSFYLDAADPLHFACRLLRRARSAGRPLAVCGPAGLLKQLDALLWSFDPTEFIPHRLGADALPGEIALVESASELPHRALLLNLAQEMPQAAAEFERVLEVVGLEPAQVQAGRARYRAYREMGAELSHVSAAA